GVCPTKQVGRRVDSHGEVVITPETSVLPLTRASAVKPWRRTCPVRRVGDMVFGEGLWHYGERTPSEGMGHEGVTHSTLLALTSIKVNPGPREVLAAEERSTVHGHRRTREHGPGPRLWGGEIPGRPMQDPPGRHGQGRARCGGSSASEVRRPRGRTVITWPRRWWPHTVIHRVRPPHRNLSSQHTRRD